MIGRYYSVADNNKKISGDSPYSLPIYPIFALHFGSLAEGRPSPFHVPPLKYPHRTRYLFNTMAYLDPLYLDPHMGIYTNNWPTPQGGLLLGIETSSFLETSRDSPINTTHGYKVVRQKDLES